MLCIYGYCLRLPLILPLAVFFFFLFLLYQLLSVALVTRTFKLKKNVKRIICNPNMRQQSREETLQHAESVYIKKKKK